MEQGGLERYGRTVVAGAFTGSRELSVGLDLDAVNTS
jgi:hypothetical protein